MVKLAEDKFTIPRGKVIFKLDGEDGFRDLGNVKDFKFNKSTDTLEHYSSDDSKITKDDEATLAVKANGSYVGDVAKPNVMELFTMASAQTDNSQSSGTMTDLEVVAVHDRWVEIGKVDIASSGLTVQDDTDTTTYVEGTHYLIDRKHGLLMALSSGTIGDGDTLHLDGTYGARAITTLKGGTKEQVSGTLKVFGDAAKGFRQRFSAYVNLRPEGDFSMVIADNNWQEFTFNYECIDQGDGNGLYQYDHMGVNSDIA